MHLPKTFTRFFKWYCKPHLQEQILGDLEEQFEEDIKNLGLTKAKRKFGWNVIRFFRPDIIKTTNGVTLNYYGMFKHNLRITLRGFLRHKTVFAINLTGLIASLTCVLFSALWINDELQKDRFHEDSDKLFQIYTKFLGAENIRVWRGATGLIDPEIEAQLPQVEISSVSTDTHEYTMSIGTRGFKVKGKFADDDYLSVFNYPLLKGEKTALRDPSTILITQTLANRLFGTEDVMDKTVDWHFKETTKTFKVGGVLKDLPVTSSEQFEYLLPWTYYHDELINYKGWGNFYGRVVVKLDPAQKPLAEQKINEIYQKHEADDKVQFFLTPYADQYLYGNYENGVQAGGRIDYVNLTIIVAIFILLIACINFINLSTAFSSLKTKEIGVKKSFGASRGNLAFQFFSESILLSIVAILIASILVAVLLQPFNQLTGKQLSLSVNPSMIGVGLLIVSVIGLIAGIYPAMYLSRMEVISALKAKLSSNQKKGAFGRQSLVFVQFTLSIMLIIGTLIVGKQMNYVLTKNLGYDRDNLIYFLREGALFENSEAFETALRNVPGVKAVSRSNFSVGAEMMNRTMGLRWEGKEEGQQVAFWENKGDANSVDILGLELLAGRGFSDELNDENSIIFNETAIRAIGYEDPIGKTVQHYSGKKTIIGIVKDFTTESLHKSIEPAMFFYRPEGTRYVIAKIEKGQELATLEKVEALYEEFNPMYPFTPQFIDQDYQAMYHAEMRVAKLSRIFAGLAILISCLGLFGLTIFQVQRKVKEIGIRKVLGANSLKLAASMTYAFTKAVFIAMIVALPLSYFLGHKWLENFADGVTLNWWLFASAAMVAIVISWLTVGAQTLKAANANPVESLKDE